MFTAECPHFLLHILYTVDTNLPANVLLDQYEVQSVLQLDKKKTNKKKPTKKRQNNKSDLEILHDCFLLALLLAVRAAKEAIPRLAQQLRRSAPPDMITLGSLSLQQVSTTKGKNICVIIPHSPPHQPRPLCKCAPR